MKDYKKMLLAAVVVCLLPMILSAIVYQDLPDRIAIHWDSAGNPNGYASKFIGAFGLPVFMALIEVVCVVGTMHDPKKQNQSQAARLMVFWLIPVLSLVLQTATLFFALGRDINITVIASTLVGIVFIITGNYLPKSRQNYTIGIKIPWTLANVDNWNKTHRLGGILFILGGVFMIASNFIPIGATARTVITIGVILVTVFVPIVYSFLLYIRGER